MAIWAFGANHIPVGAERKKMPKDLTHWCQEGDPEWTRRDGHEEEEPEPVVGWAELLGDLPDD